MRVSFDTRTVIGAETRRVGSTGVWIVYAEYSFSAPLPDVNAITSTKPLSRNRPNPFVLNACHRGPNGFTSECAWYVANQDAAIVPDGNTPDAITKKQATN